MVWFVAFGGTALFHEIKGISNTSSQVYTQPKTGLFLMLNQLPFGSMLSILALFLICFFITSANSATYVLGT
ncbi:BCCT family transporter [Anaerobacillus arseniciselenatis]|uniref:BCCT family transporter n=1 Tax=Anaerobacillus arseniciselenatis TaxID=85682 RepID=UPI000A0477ED